MRKQNLRLLALSIVVMTLTTVIGFGLQTRRVDDNALKNSGKTGAEWLTVGLNYAEQRFSPLKLIDTTNVSRLGLAWSYDIGPGGNGGQQATPLEANGVIYGITNWSITFAVDARTGKEKWRYDPKVDHSINDNGTDRICCGVVNRGIALYEGKVIVPVIDGRLVALDEATGRELWSVLAVPKDSVSYTLTIAPRIVKGKIIIGNAGAEFPPYRGYFAAYDVNNGKELWKFYTVPGDPSKPFENDAMKAAAKTWAGDWWKLGGGGSVWDGMAYDPEANLLYVGIGNGTPWSQTVRQGNSPDHLDNLYVASIVAVNPDNGQLKWHYQCTPGDEWDYDAVQHLVLADLRINGRDRRVIMQANKNGFFYVIDRVTGEFISGEPFAPVSWASGIDPKTGRANVNPEARYSSQRGVTVSPAYSGAHSWAQMAFNPATGLVYVPTAPAGNYSYTAQPTFVPTPGAQNFGLNNARGGGNAAPLATPPMIGPVRQLPTGQRGGILSAWDPVTQKEKWFVMGGGAIGGGVLTTAGNLVLQVVTDGRLIAYTADKGEKLMEVATGQRGGMGPPMTYQLDGKQYVAVMGGAGAGGGGRGAVAAAAESLPARLYVYSLK